MLSYIQHSHFVQEGFSIQVNLISLSDHHHVIFFGEFVIITCLLMDQFLSSSIFQQGEMYYIPGFFFWLRLQSIAFILEK